MRGRPVAPSSLCVMYRQPFIILLRTTMVGTWGEGVGWEEAASIKNKMYRGAAGLRAILTLKDVFPS
ncbi:hypothetical protein XELAEV_18030929mg [Xenopus laevis]|uniref:Uncharacterized protein n=1 Tax=Xenopus laevis TaxID=8355 RepID=A0A974CM61_XENLA|nr:hypothetical protein XELAEV_18030929mg [Xenopus laevis]